MSKYDLQKIADEIRKTALNEAYYGNALYVALDFDFLTKDHKTILRRHLNEIQRDDRLELNDIAIIIENHKYDPKYITDKDRYGYL